MSHISHNSPEMQPDPDRRRRVMTLWAAVLGTMAVVVAAWLLILPWQIGSMVSAARMDSSRWSVVNPDDKQEGFMETLKQVGENFDRLTAQEAASGAPSTLPEPPPEIKQFVEKLKTASDQAPEPASAPTEGQPAASQP